jgi:uncharacterized OB-fold protein
MSAVEIHELIGLLKQRVEALEELIDARLHIRKCHNCGHVNFYSDNVFPYCCCYECKSPDTRLVKCQEN